MVNGGNGWTTRPDPVDADDASFLTSYDWCTRSHTIDLLAKGYAPEFLDSSPPILVWEYFKGVNNVSDSYFLRVGLRDENGLVLQSWEAGFQPLANSSGVFLPRLRCGQSSLYFFFQAATTTRASLKV